MFIRKHLTISTMKYSTQILIAFVSILTLFSCSETEDPIDRDAVDEKIIQEFVALHDSVFTRHSSGIYYKINRIGEGDKPEWNYTIDVAYKGMLTDSTVFDQSGSFTYPLNQLIKGWQIAIPMLNAGGSGTFIIPSKLAYGAEATKAIPANSVLVFDITLHRVIKPLWGD